MELQRCPTGSAARVSRIDLAESERVRFREMGLGEGAVIHIVHHGAFGGRVVAVGADRFALDGRTCACIGVEPVVVG